MARKKLLHLRSSVVEGQGVNSAPKLPTPEQIEIGEIAINFAKGYETLSIKNASGEVVTFTNDEYWVEKERVVAAALNDLDERKADASAVTSVETIVTAHTANTTIHVTAEDKEKLDNALSGVSVNAVPLTVSDSIVDIPSATTTDFGVVKMDTELDSGSTNAVMNSAITTVILSNERVTAAALNDLEERKVDATAIAPLTAHTANTTIHVTSEDKTKWNNALSGVTVNDTPLTPSARVVTIPSATTSVFGVVKVDAALDSGSTNPVANSAITKIIDDKELVIAAAFNDLNNRKADASGITSITSSIDEINNNYVSAVTVNGGTKITGKNINIPAATVNTYGVVVLDTTLDTGSTNPVANSAIAAALDDKLSGVAIPRGVGYHNVTVENGVAKIPPADTTIFGVVKMDAALDTGSTSPVANSAITIAINEKVSGVSLNGGSTIAPINGVIDIPMATSGAAGVTIVKNDLETNSGSTDAISCKAVYDVIVDNEIVMAGALNDLNNRIAELEARIAALENPTP